MALRCTIFVVDYNLYYVLLCVHCVPLKACREVWLYSELEDRQAAVTYVSELLTGYITSHKDHMQA